MGLKHNLQSPNSTIRNIIKGVVYREPIVISNIPNYITNWTQPIIVAKHAYGDTQNSKSAIADKPGKVEVVFTPEDGSEPTRHEICGFKEGGVYMGMYNTDKSIRSFARSSLTYALERGYPCKFSSMNTTVKDYDDHFVSIFNEIYASEFQGKY